MRYATSNLFTHLKESYRETELNTPYKNVKSENQVYRISGVQEESGIHYTKFEEDRGSVIGAREATFNYDLYRVFSPKEDEDGCFVDFIRVPHGDKKTHKLLEWSNTNSKIKYKEEDTVILTEEQREEIIDFINRDMFRFISALDYARDTKALPYFIKELPPHQRKQIRTLLKQEYGI